MKDTLSYDPDEQPDCPDCETDLFVEGCAGKDDDTYRCHFCGWRSDQPVKPDGGISDIVPEGFDLHDAMQAESSTPEEKRKRCPECESSGNLVPLVNNHIGGDPEANYRCDGCGHKFDKPLTGVVR